MYFDIVEKIGPKAAHKLLKGVENGTLKTEGGAFKLENMPLLNLENSMKAPRALVVRKYPKIWGEVKKSFKIISELMKKMNHTK